MAARTLLGRLSTRCLNVSGGMAAILPAELESPFLEPIIHKPFPHSPCFMAGSTVMLIQTIVITELIFYRRQYAVGQHILVSFSV
jgi:hypothetical protein